MTMRREAEEIASRRAIDVVCAPIWDVEGIAFLGGGFGSSRLSRRRCTRISRRTLRGNGTVTS